MFSDTKNLAENKLLLLYILDKINLPISNNQITQIVLENNFLNYFTLQQYITELAASEFINYIDQQGKYRLIITQKGLNVLSLFMDRISTDKKSIIDTYLENEIENIKRELTISADYTIEGNNYIVNLKALENNSILLDLKVNVASNEQARSLCSKWKSNSSKMYNQIMRVLINS